MVSTLPARLPRRRTTLPVVLAVIATVASGCGGSARSSTTSTTSASAGGARAATSRAKFISCLEAHGVPAGQATQGFGFRHSAGSVPSGATATPPSTSAAFAAAFQACRSDLPSRGNRGLQNSAAGRAYLQCLQLHGVTFPSVPPTTVAGTPAGTAPVPGGPFRSIASNPAYKAARTACAALAPARAGGAGGVSSTSSTTAAG